MSQLTKMERRWATAAWGTIFPGTESSPSMEQMDVDGFLTDLCGTVPFKTFFGLRVAILLVALAPLFVIGKFATIRGLASADRERLLSKLFASRSYLVRQLSFTLKAIGSMLYAAHPVVRARMMRPRPQAKPLVALRLKRSEAA